MKFGISQLVLLPMLFACSTGTNQVGYCSKVLAESVVRSSNPLGLEEIVRKNAAPGGELIIEFRKDDVLGDATHQKKCSFFLEPSNSAADQIGIWTASHCLSLARDANYRLRFYVDYSTGYVEIPVTAPALEQFQKVREEVGVLPEQIRRGFLESFKSADIDFSRSKNGSDICLNSFKTGWGWSKFHQPLPDKNQVACFLYHDLSVVQLKVADNISSLQQRVLENILESARLFDENSVAHPNATLQRTDESPVKMKDFRSNWIKVYKEYTELKEQSGFLKFASHLETDCGATSEQPLSTDSCQILKAVQDLLNETGFESYAELLTESGASNYEAKFDGLINEIADLWSYYRNAVIIENGYEVRAYESGTFNILANYSWNGSSLKSFSALPLMAYVGVGFGQVIDPWSGDVRSRVGAATYHWLEKGKEMFVYAIIPKTQTESNLKLGYGQLNLKPGDSGTLLLVSGLPMAVLATVDGEKTSGGAAVLPLPKISDEMVEDISNVQFQPDLAEGPVQIQPDVADVAQGSVQTAGGPSMTCLF